MFLGKDNHLMVMHFPPGFRSIRGPSSALKDDDLRRLRDVGVKTIFTYSIWRELVALGPSHTDCMVEQARRVGMKIVLASYRCPPENMPDAYYIKDKAGNINRKCLSLWNQDAQAAVIRFFQRLRARYDADDVLVVYQGFDSGEVVYPRKTPSLYDAAALASHAKLVGGVPDPKHPSRATLKWLARSIVHHYLAVDGALLTQHNEIWCSMHPYLARYGAFNGNFAQAQLLKTESRRWPQAMRVLFQYTFWHNNKYGYKPKAARWIRDYNLKMIVEAGYCKGLPETAPAAVEARFLGQVVCPVHPLNLDKKLEASQISAIAQAVRTWRRAPGTPAGIPAGMGRRAQDRMNLMTKTWEKAQK